MPARRPSPPVPARRRAELIVVGASAGGVSALLNLLAPLPASFPLPIVAVLHLLPRRESRLGSVLGSALALPVREPVDKQAIEPGQVYVAPPDYHLMIELDRSFSFSSEAPVSYARPSIDVLMSSAADAFGPGLVGALLTGANMDGAEGMAAIRARGGVTLVQRPDEAEVATMPQAAIDRCPPDHILPLQDMSQFLIRLARGRGLP
jgi:two-component system chemotaxis response regulator CheB